MQTLDIYCILGQQIAASGPQDPTPPTFNFFSDDDYAIRLNPLSPVLDPSSVNRFNPSAFDFVTFEIALGLIDSTPISGKWTIGVTGDSVHTTTELDAAAAPGAVATALNLLPAVIAAGGVVVTQGNTANVWVISPVTPGTDLTFDIRETNLVPLCLSKVRKGSNTNGSFTMVKLFKAPYAYTDSFAFGEPPAVQVVMGRVGASTASCIQYLTFPAGTMGDFDLVYGGFHTALIPADGSATATTIAAALNGLFADGTTNPRFNVSSSVNNIFQILCVGPLANQAVALLGSNMYGQVPLLTPEAAWHLAEVPIELAVAGLPSIPMVLCLVGTDEAGNESTLVQQAATVTNRMIAPGTSQAIAAIATVTNTIYQTVDPTDDATIIGQMSVSAVLTGSGSVGTPTPYVQGVVHNLDTLTPEVLLFEQTAVAPDKWREMADTEYNAASSDGDPNTVTVSLAFTPPTAGHVGAVKIFCINPLASVNVNSALTLPLTKVYRASDNVTLDVILAAIVASLPTDWPAVPAGTISGTLEPSQIDLTALAASFATNGAFLTVLQNLISNATVIKNIAVALNTSTDFIATLTSLFASTPALLDALVKDILADTNFVTGLAPLILAALGGTVPLSNTLPIQLPTIDWSMPALNADGSYAELPAAQVGSTSLGNLTGNAPAASAANAGKTYAVVSHAYVRPARRKTFFDGDVILSTGEDWYLALFDAGTTGVAGVTHGTTTIDYTPNPAVVPGMLVTGTDIPAATYVVSVTSGHAVLSNAATGSHSAITFTFSFDTGYAAAFEKELFTVYLNDGMLIPNSTFNVLFQFGLSVAGNCEGHYLFELRRGTPQAAGGSSNLTVENWDEVIISAKIIITDATVLHRFGYTLVRTADVMGSPVIAATKQEELLISAATALTSPALAIQARLTHFDTENVPRPAGQVKVTMSGQVASIVKLS